MTLIDKGADVNEKLDGQTPLHIASNYGHNESIKLLLRYMRNINEKR